MPGLGNKRPQSIRLGFLRLLAILMAFSLASSAVLIWAAYGFARDQAKRQMVDTTRALAEVVDGMFARDEAMLRALAVSPSAQKRDWPSVRREAMAVLHEPDAWIVVGDRNGRQLVNTRLPDNAVLPRGKNPTKIWPLLDKGLTHICDLTSGLVEPHITCVDVPVVIGGRTEYFISVIMRPQALGRLFERQHLPARWNVATLDSRGAIVWRSGTHQHYIGTRAPQFFASAKAQDAGLLSLRNSDGVPTYAAFGRAQVSRWFVIVAAPRKQFSGGVIPALLGSFAIVLVLMQVGGLLAFQWTRVVSRGVENLAAQARALGSREHFTGSPTRIKEFAEISAALSQAEASLATRDRQLEALTASQAERVETALAERETALAQLHEAQKLETLGQLTGGVAHDFNNLLTPIMGALDLLQRRLGHDEKAARLIDAALGGAERAKELVARLLAFARRQALRPRAVDVGALLHGMSDFLQHSLGAGVVVRIAPTIGRAVAHVDPNQLEMAILNLAVNARDAMPDGGSLAIAVSDDREAAGSGLPPADYVRITVSDTGRGMDESTRLRAIEPFFTTKAHGRGTGLGLSMVHGLAAQSGGGFQLTSERGKGTQIDLWLPASDQAVQAPTESREQPGPAGGRRGRILLVDDEPLVRAGTAELLAELGYDIVPAASAAEALDRLRGDSAIEAMVTDYMMPGMNGAALIAEVRKSRPLLPVVLITGYTTPDLDLPQNIVRLAKPFRQKHLAESLDAAFAQGVCLVGPPQN
ncbi:Signal transduction histidine kinase [Sphingomonas sp. YR710]|uniref:ATP-binding protein n=1 Tax=Sphingomonas sp. YR710 TaxID=1882773 RepID=UPI00088A1E36|nr:ATP-binding protein [Sphingomonas sp. YR710]SDC77709.1 Signal transduction histidine kinase [Sphingomonas sp. YR710]